MFSELRAEMSQAAGRDRLLRDHGTETCERLWQVVVALTIETPVQRDPPAAANRRGQRETSGPLQAAGL